MSISRIKTIIIFILAIVNVCFLTIYFIDRFDDMVLDNQTGSRWLNFWKLKALK